MKILRKNTFDGVATEQSTSLWEELNGSVPALPHETNKGSYITSPDLALRVGSDLRTTSDFVEVLTEVVTFSLAKYLDAGEQMMESCRATLLGTKHKKMRKGSWMANQACLHMT